MLKFCEKIKIMIKMVMQIKRILDLTKLLIIIHYITNYNLHYNLRFPRKSMI